MSVSTLLIRFFFHTENPLCHLSLLRDSLFAFPTVKQNSPEFTSQQLMIVSQTRVHLVGLTPEFRWTFRPARTRKPTLVGSKLTKQFWCELFKSLHKRAEFGGQGIKPLHCCNSCCKAGPLPTFPLAPSLKNNENEFLNQVTNRAVTDVDFCSSVKRLQNDGR